MLILSGAEMDALLGSISLLNSSVSWETLPERSLKAVHSLIATDMVAFDGFDVEYGYQNSYWFTPSHNIPAEKIEVFGGLVHEHPYYAVALSTQDHEVFRVTDYLPLKDFHDLALYNEFYRSFGGDTQMTSATRLSPTSVITCSAMRPERDFSESELKLFTLLAPHLAAAFRNALAFKEQASELRYLERYAAKGVVVLNSQFRVKFMSGLASTLLHIYFDEAVGGGLPEELGRFVRLRSSGPGRAGHFAPPEIFRVRSERGELEIRLAFEDEEREIVLILDEKADLAADTLAPLGLTERETEILLWMCRGKTDQAIAQLCGISVRTVNKHVEHMFEKLGVETRTAAVNAAYRSARRV